MFSFVCGLIHVILMVWMDTDQPCQNKNKPISSQASGFYLHIGTCFLVY